MAEMDALELRITGDAQKAVASIDSIIKKLNQLSGALNIDTSKLGNIGKNLNFSEISSGAKTMADNMSKATAKVVESMKPVEAEAKKIARTFQEVAEPYKDLGKGFTIKGSTEEVQKKVDKLSNSLAEVKLKEESLRLGGKTNLEGYETAVKNIIMLENQIDSLKTQLLDVNNIAQNEPKISLMVSEETSRSLQEIISDLERYRDIIQSGGLESEAGTYQPFAEAQRALNELIERFPEATNEIKAFESEFERLGAFRPIENIWEGAEIPESLKQSTSDFSKEIGEATQKLSQLQKEASKDGLEKLNNSLSGINKSLKSTSSTMDKTAKSSKNLAFSLAKIYAAVKVAEKAIKSLWKSIESSFNYLEVANYFDAAFEQVAQNADLSAFEKMGYDSVESYYDSFSKRAKELTTKMSGFTVDASGILQSTGGASLGIDPSQLMNYQAMFGQMANSMGVASERALDLSNALTMIGADLASVKNMDFDKVWQDMASGLTGMSRTLDKYGVNIRDVNLQQKLAELGIDATVSALNQNDKALLRTIVLLDSTRYAWGDMADTINQPANQLRLIQANFQNLSRTIGNLFLPIVQTVLPYVNALVIALQRLFSWLGSLIGLDLSGITNATKSMDMGNFLDQTGDLASGLGAAEKAAKKLKSQLLGIDELNIISPEEDEGAGAGALSGISGGLLDAAFEDALSEYQKVWDEAFANLENRAQEIADSIEKAFEPIEKIFEDFAIGDFFQAGKDTSNLVIGITDFISTAIDNVDWRGIGQKIGDFIAGVDWVGVLESVGNLIWQAISAAIETWEGIFSAAPIETAIITAIAALKFTGLGDAWVETLSTKMSATIAGKSIGLGPTILIAAATWKIGFDVGKEIGKALFPEDVEIYANFKWMGDGGFFDEVFSDLGSSFDGLVNMVTDFENNPIIAGLSTFLVGSLTGGLGIAAIYIWRYKDDIANGFDSIIGKIQEFTASFTDGTWLEALSLWGNDIEESFGLVGEAITEWWNGVVDWWNNSAISVWWEESVAPWFTVEKWKTLFNNVKVSFQTKWNEISTQWKTNLSTWWNTNVAPWFTVVKWVSSMSGIKEAFKQTFKNAANVAIEIFNKLINWINEKMHFEWDAIEIAGIEVVPAGSVQLFTIPTIPRFKAGGFPEDGLFYKNNDEIITQVAGRTQVLNSADTYDMIRSAAYEGQMQAQEELIRYLADIAQNTRETAEKDMSVQIGDRDIVKAYDRGRNSMGMQLRTT